VIVISIALVLIAAGLLAAGLLQGSDTLYYASIVMSVLAALSLTVGVRQAPAAHAADEDFDVRPGLPPETNPHEADDDVADRGAYLPPRQVRRADQPDRSATDAGPEPVIVVDRGSEGQDLDPPDEPPIQEASVADAARVATMVTEVFVIDGRPRYHLGQCLHLLGRDYEGLPVSEAVELGFTPCAHCRPIRVLLAAAPKGLI
jgi:hypothetical protein